nr:ribonuclease H-like domain-containing protein [Tanacetum cinerariifolium]
MEEMDIKWNMALLSMRADKFWKKTGKKISIQGSDVAGFDKSKVECFNYHKMGHFTRECRAPKNQEKGNRDTYRQGSKAKEQTPKALMAIDGVGWDWSYMKNDEEDHALVAEAPTEFALMANTTTENKVFANSLCSKDCKKNNNSLNSKITDFTDELFDANNMIYHYKLALPQVESRLVEYKEREVKYIEKIRTLEFYDEGKVEYIETLKKELETLKQEKEVVDRKLAGLLSASKNLDNLIESQRSDKKYADNTVTDYSRPSPTVESSSEEDQDRNPSASENVVSPITPKQPFQRKSTVRSQYKASWVPTVNMNFPPVNRKFSTGSRNFPTANKKLSIASRKVLTGSTKGPNVDMGMKGKAVKPSAHSECLVLGRDFILLDDANILLRTPRQHNMYSIDLNNIVPHRDLTCLVAKASADECNLWHRRLGHLNFKTMNKLVRHNLVRGLPTKCFENDHNCTACLKGKQHKASCSHGLSFSELRMRLVAFLGSSLMK